MTLFSGMLSGMLRFLSHYLLCIPYRFLLCFVFVILIYRVNIGQSSSECMLYVQLMSTIPQNFLNFDLDVKSSRTIVFMCLS